MAVILLHPSLCLQASCSGILVWFSHGAALFPYHFPDALYCIFIAAGAASTGPSGYLFWDFYWILNKYVCHWGSLAGFLTYFIEAMLPDKTLTSYFNSNLVSLLSHCTVSYMFALAELHLLLFFLMFPSRLGPSVEAVWVLFCSRLHFAWQHNYTFVASGRWNGSGSPQNWEILGFG